MPDDSKENKQESAVDQGEGAAETRAADEPTKAAGAEADAELERASSEEDVLRPDVIARRVAALGGEDVNERLAREEEERLQQRRRELKKKGGKKGLEAAASKRLAKIGGKVKRPVASAVPFDDDPLMARTARVTKWVKENAKVVAWAAVAGVIGLSGLLGWQYWQDRKEAAASLILSEAIADERGRIGDPDKEEDEGSRPKDPRPVFKTTEARRDAALAKYREVVAKFPGTGAAILARLGEGSILLDKHDTEGAIAAFEEVKTSPLAAADAEVKGRALEGIGFVHELKAATNPEEKDKELDLAIKSFKELELLDASGFKELGLYHQARCLEAKGDKLKAIELLRDVNARIAKVTDEHPFSYLQFVVEDRLRALDPNALPPKSPANGLFGPNSQFDMSDPRIRKLVEQVQRDMQTSGGSGPVKP